MATLMNDEQLEFDLGADEKATDVAIQGDSSDEKGGEQAAPVVENAQENQQQAHSSELDTVNDAVQKRIAKLTARMREAERREQAAVEYARGLQTQTQTLQQRLVQTDYSRLTEAKARQVDAILREFPEIRYTLATLNTGAANGKIYASLYVRLLDRKLRQRNVDQVAAAVRERLRQLKWRWHELETLWDIDRPDDYRRWSELIILNENKYLA